MMEWIKLQLHVIRSEEYIGCEPVHRAAYINLLAFCVDQENSGTIANCADWSDRKWMQLCGVMKSEVESCELFWFNGEDLEIYAYPIDEQKSCESKRAKCRAAQLVRWERERKKQPSRSPTTDESQPSTEESREEETILEKRGVDETDACSPSQESVNIDPSTEWHAIKSQEWIQNIKGGLGKIGSGNWQEWQGVMSTHSLELILAVLPDTKAGERWPDTILEKIVAYKAAMKVTAINGKKGFFG